MTTGYMSTEGAHDKDLVIVSALSTSPTMSNILFRMVWSLTNLFTLTRNDWYAYIVDAPNRFVEQVVAQYSPRDNFLHYLRQYKCSGPV